VVIVNLESPQESWNCLLSGLLTG